MIKITFPDGSVREYESGVTGLQIAESISQRLAQDVLACGVNGETIELNRPITSDASINLYKWDDEQGSNAFLAHFCSLDGEPCRSCGPARSSVSVRLSKMASTMT